jgi:AbrB family looped-hinge helix DNA binding protein
MKRAIKFVVKVDARGRTVIPRAVLEALNLSKGDTVEFDSKGGRVIIRAGRK